MIKLYTYDVDDTIIEEKKLTARFCHGDRPPIIEIVLNKKGGAGTYIEIPLDYIGKLMSKWGDK